MLEFFAEEEGAVTVDWVVLTAALVGLGLAVMAVVSDGVGNVSIDTATELASVDPGALAFGEASQSAGYTDRFDWGSWNGGQYGSSADFIATHYGDSASEQNRLRNDMTQIAGWANQADRSQSSRDQHADLHASGYNQLETQGFDMSGVGHPDDVLPSAT